MLNFYDFETYKTRWFLTVINPIDKTEIQITNDKAALERYYDEHKNQIWIGYNSNGYDQYILKAIICDFDPKAVNDFIILDKKKGWQYSRLFRTIPLYDFDIGSKFHSLKQLEGFMGNDIRETEIPFDYDGEFTPEMIAKVFKYNRHDVEQTIEVFLERRTEFDAHMALIKIFNLSMSNISKSQAMLAATILGANRNEVLDNDEWCIRLPETLRLGKYKYVADWFMNPMNHNYTASLDTTIAGVPHSFAWGGVHGAISKFNYTCKSDEIMIMADVSQLYPFLMKVYHLLARSCPEKAYEILDDTIATSLRLKAEGKKAEREPYKRFNNIIYGSMGDEYNPMYDPLHRNLVCVYGQLLILDLIEKVEPFAKLIQSNTDGVLLKIKKKDFELLDDTVYEWEKRTGLMMEFDEYVTVYQGDVNNYVVVTADGKYKSKGAYVKSLSPIDYDLPIVNRAIVDFLVKGTPVEKTINECNDLIEFQKIVKVSSKYAFAVHNGKVLSDKTFRVFASNSRHDGYIGKCKREGATVEKFASTPEHCFVWNESVNDVRVPDNLDKKWYIDLASKRIREKFDLYA